MSWLGKTIHVKGELRTTEDLRIEGRIEGPVVGEDCAVVFEPSSDMQGDVTARDITVSGRVSGQLVATDIVDVRAEGRFTGTVVAPRFILDEAAHFVGRVEPQHLEAALRVQKYQQKKREVG